MTPPNPIRDEWTSPDGSVRLLLGDCLEILPTLDREEIGAVVADAPYGLAYDASTSTQQGIKSFDPIEGDSVPFDISPFVSFPDVLIWSLPQLTLGVPVGMGAWYAWDKTTRNDLGCRISEYEYCWHKRATKTRGFRHLWSGAYRASEAGRERLHPTQKPVALMAWCLKHVQGEVICDPFTGSGTTGVACIRTQRRFIGIEISEQYFRVAVDRCQRELGRFPLFEQPAKSRQRELLP